jgi:hypothetical protein
MNLGNADVNRNRNLVGLGLQSGNADVTRGDNLQASIMEQPLLPQLTITNLRMTDKSGNTRTSLRLGDTEVRFTGTNIASFNFPNGLITATITNPSSQTVLLSYTIDSINVGMSRLRF